MATSFTYGARSGGQLPEALVRFITEEQLKGFGDPANVIIHPEIDARLKKGYDKEVFQAKPKQTEIVSTLGLFELPYIVFVGYEDGSGLDGIRRAAAAAAKALKSIRVKHAEVLLQSTILNVAITEKGADAVAQALTEGLVLALHDRKPLKKDQTDRFALEEITFKPEAGFDEKHGNKQVWELGINRGKIITDGVGYARDLTNLPGNDLTPERLAFHAEELANSLDLEIEVIDEWTATEQRMGGLLSVGQGSINPPRMIVIHYKGASDSSETLGLIGKGITFDTGGISLKKAPGMEEMISDMGGAAAVLGAVKALAELKAEVNIVAVIPTAENMPSDRAFKPGDVIRTMSGYTVEIVNTDAEGRLVLADGLTTAIRRGATKLIDVATLTGAVMVALGYEATGAVTNNDSLMEEVKRASEQTGERVWQLPAYAEFKNNLKSDAADLKNSGSRYGGASAGGLFIGHFAEGLPWVHLDIGGTAWLEASRGWEPKGATGVMVRTLVELASTKK
ncbi:leucyl aminopeptidase [Paenibacillus sp. GSMTC-2017]|uniref:leucyl aminopeptidase n=1 Tax=Paenibacillus sp. GSMTC-2017 TaxID=2794350 RepID=UPI0018D7ED51|nr:leucyl aminopeptidase [Paenibacillus sp. GSMTC-2017]MBH5317369.1 leucyl aminopeptidase [Paenibacillus sp. GSMTC-2017]